MGIGNQDETAFAFEGKWQDYAPIALTNALLIFVTLGFYRFWATTRERNYLWSKTRFVDDKLEWTGTGKELFFGFIIAMAAIFGFGIAAALVLTLLGYISPALLFIGILALYIGVFAIFGIAQFRATKYRLSRTVWHGIRGGTDDNGVKYGLAWVWKRFAGMIALGMLVPWAMVDLFKDMWSKMSFGQHKFVSNPVWTNVFGRYLLAIFGSIGLFILAGVAFWAAMPAAVEGALPQEPPGWILALFLIAYLGVGILSTAFYAVFFRETIGTLSLSTLNFSFSARTKDWIILFLGHAGLVLLAIIVGVLIASPFGLLTNMMEINPITGQPQANPVMLVLAIIAFSIPFAMIGPFLRYRNWRFFIRHMEASGEIDLVKLTQSSTRANSDTEGLLDAFGAGAI
jgi:uncharacterized membrane protein YjgN (DUF898 family)